MKKRSAAVSQPSKPRPPRELTSLDVVAVAVRDGTATDEQKSEYAAQVSRLCASMLHRLHFKSLFRPLQEVIDELASYTFEHIGKYNAGISAYSTWVCSGVNCVHQRLLRDGGLMPPMKEAKILDKQDWRDEDSGTVADGISHGGGMVFRRKPKTKTSEVPNDEVPPMVEGVFVIKGKPVCDTDKSRAIRTAALSLIQKFPKKREIVRAIFGDVSKDGWECNDDFRDKDVARRSGVSESTVKKFINDYVRPALLKENALAS